MFWNPHITIQKVLLKSISKTNNYFIEVESKTQEVQENCLRKGNKKRRDLMAQEVNQEPDQEQVGERTMTVIMTANSRVFYLTQVHSIYQRKIRE